MELQRLEYIRKNGRTKGKKKGVVWCGIDPDDDQSVIVGFALCHGIDKFDYLDGQREEGFGLSLAKSRAEKFRFHTDYFVQKTFTEKEFNDNLEYCIEGYIINSDPKSIVEIPPSVIVRLKPFIERCKKYYKDKEFPVWVNQIEAGNPTTILDDHHII
jgi:hypothetical protein